MAQVMSVPNQYKQNNQDVIIAKLCFLFNCQEEKTT